MATVIVIGIIVVLVIVAIIKISKDKSKGKCTGCPYAGNCHKDSCSNS